ncbi:metalloregulator ArsR/SmtB family transcription factor [Archangium sp.]|uniref:ArsR/SmtB family transcription factor n=1 Tax=Archangium sp. TaxID=1872627 RepID=UPI00286B88F0|nr:metalloregulator ArsR/SmtB family transcription factor [Archangium sp.]
MRRGPTARSWKDSAPLFAALGDETRLRVVARLCEEGPLSITRLTEGADVSRQAVTKHLQILASAGLVTNTRDGRENVWQLEPARLAEARRLLDLISKEWDDTLDRLRDFVEK